MDTLCLSYHEGPKWTERRKMGKRSRLEEGNYVSRVTPEIIHHTCIRSGWKDSDKEYYFPFDLK